MTPTYPPGTPIGPYEIVRLLPGGDSGAMASVYLARLRPGYRGVASVALKIASPQPVHIDFLKHEESHMRRFDSTYLLKILPIPQKPSATDRPAVYTAKVDPEHPHSPWFIAVEYMAGGSVEQVLRRCGRLRPRHAVEIVGQVAQGLEELHRAEIVHLDIKPSNMLVRMPLSRVRAEVPDIVISDFGVARALNAGGETLVYGTRAYLAPERAKGEPPHPRHDMFALGVVLYELLTGTLPYGDDAPSANALGDAELPSARRRGISPELEEIILRAIAIDPQERYQDARQFLRDFDTLPDIERPVAFRLPLLQGRREYLAAGGAALGLLVLLGLARVVPGAWDSMQTVTPTAPATLAPKPTAEPTAEPTVAPTSVPTPTFPPTSTPIPPTEIVPTAQP